MKKIITFYKKNKAISNIGVVATAISLSYAITYNMPDYFGIGAYYSLVNNICISYIAALIFFVVQVYIPESRNQKKCLEVLKNKFAELIKFNEVAILLCEKHIEIKEKGATISWNGDGEKIYIKAKSDDESKGPNLEAYTKEQLLNWKAVFDAKIKIIKETAVINYCDYEILEKLSELERCDFFTGFTYLIKFAESDIDIRSFNNAIIDFKRVNEELKRMCLISEHYQLIDVSEDDMSQLDSIYKCLTNNTLSIESFNREIMKTHIEKQLENEGVKLSNQEIEMMCDVVMNTNKSK